MPGGRSFARASCAALVALALVAPRAEAEAAGVGCGVSDVRLANGLRVLVCPTAAGAGVSIQLRYDVGARDEPGPLAGIAHLAEHLMFTGSRHVGAGEHLRLLDQVGATNLNGRTTIDATVYYETVPPERLALALWLESDRMGYLLDHVDETALSRERAAVLNEYKDRLVDVPLGAVYPLLVSELFPSWHPYHHVALGTAASIQRIGLADVRAFLGTWYGPANATLAIAGPVDPGAVLSLAQGYFASLPARPPPARPALPPLPERAPVLLRIGANMMRSTVAVAWITPRLDAPGDAELDVAAAILAQRGVGWLHRRLGRMAAAVSAVQESKLLASIFRIEVTVADGFRPAEVLAAIDDALAHFDVGVSADELRRAQLAWYATKLFRLEGTAAWAGQLASAAGRQSSPIRLFDGDLAMYSAISPDRVREAVRAHLGRAHRVVAVVEPERRHPSRGVLLERRELSP